MSAVDVLRRLTGDVGASRLEKRIKQLPSEDLVLWTENAIVGVGRAFGDWQTKGLPDSLGEAQVGAASLLMVLDELARRRDAGGL